MAAQHVEGVAGQRERRALLGPREEPFVVVELRAERVVDRGVGAGRQRERRHVDPVDAGHGVDAGVPGLGLLGRGGVVQPSLAGVGRRVGGDVAGDPVHDPEGLAEPCRVGVEPVDPGHRDVAALGQRVHHRVLAQEGVVGEDAVARRGDARHQRAGPPVVALAPRRVEQHRLVRPAGRARDRHVGHHGCRHAGDLVQPPGQRGGGRLGVALEDAHAGQPPAGAGASPGETATPSATSASTSAGA